MEEQSYSTKENAELSLNVIQAKEWNSVVVSTSHFHQFRSKGVFQKAIETRKLSKAKVKMLNQVQESSYSRHVDGRERTRESLRLGNSISLENWRLSRIIKCGDGFKK